MATGEIEDDAGLSYVKSTLISGEKIIYHTKLHWIVFAKPIIFLLLTWIIYSFVVHWSRILGSILGFTFLFIGLMYLLTRLTTYISNEFVVTNKRLVMKLGFGFREVEEILLDKIESFMVDQNTLGIILNFGAIIATGTGGTRNIFENIADPIKFRRITLESIDCNRLTK
jgi:hypothetical protein